MTVRTICHRLSYMRVSNLLERNEEKSLQGKKRQLKRNSEKIHVWNLICEIKWPKEAVELIQWNKKCDERSNGIFPQEKRIDATYNGLWTPTLRRFSFVFLFFFLFSCLFLGSSNLKLDVLKKSFRYFWAVTHDRYQPNIE